MSIENFRVRVDHELSRDRQKFQETGDKILDATLRDIDLSIAIGGVARLAFIGSKLVVRWGEQQVIGRPQEK